MLNISIYICTEYNLNIQYMRTLHHCEEPLWYNTIQYIHGYFLTLMRIDRLTPKKKIAFWMACNLPALLLNHDQHIGHCWSKSCLYISFNSK